MSDLAEQIKAVLALHRRHDELEGRLYEAEYAGRQGNARAGAAAELVWRRHDRLEREIVSAWAALPRAVAALLREGEDQVATLLKAGEGA